MVLIWLFASPIHRAWAFGDLPLNRLDFVAAGIFRYSRHPAYQDYQATTSALIPLPPRGE